VKKLCLRAIKFNKLIEEKKFKTIKARPTSTRKALQMPPKEGRAIQEIITTLGLKGEVEKHPLATHEINPVTASLTAALYLKSQTDQIGMKRTI
jgi:hypothetical protein